jgi:hypothetical protein
MIQALSVRGNTDQENTNESRAGSNSMKEGTVLLLEPFYGGSHKQLIDTLIDGNIK